MKKALTLALVSATLLGTQPAQSQTLNFEGIGIGYPFFSTVPILDFYNGGSSAAGTSGINYGVQFSSDAEAVCLNSLTVFCSGASRDGVGDPNSRTGALVFTTSTRTIMNRSAGMVNAVSFQYVALDPGGTAWAWSGVNGTGTMLGSIALPASDDVGTCIDYLAFFCPFTPQTLTFSGVARSIVFTGVADQAAMDDVTFEGYVAIVPEPASLAFMALGLSLLGIAVLRRRNANRYI